MYSPPQKARVYAPPQKARVCAPLRRLGGHLGDGSKETMLSAHNGADTQDLCKLRPEKSPVWGVEKWGGGHGIPPHAEELPALKTFGDS